MIFVNKPKESLKTELIFQLSQFCCVILQSSRFCCCAFKLFLLFEELFDVKVLLIGQAVTQYHVFVVFQSEATNINSNEYLIRNVKETIVMKFLVQVRKNVNYKSYKSDCLIEISNTHTIFFGYQTHFFSQFTFKLQLASNAFECLL